MNEDEIERLTGLLKALADKTRLRILGLIAAQECTVEELAAILELKEPTVSHHLNKLKESDLVTMRPEATTHYYRLNQDRLSNVLRELSPKTLQDVAQDLDANQFERKVVQSFFVEGRLKEIPAQRKKRDVILRRLVTEFAPNEQYTEKQINETLKRFHEDTATLRREFIATKLMARENNVYWRIDGSTGRPHGNEAAQESAS